MSWKETLESRFRDLQAAPAPPDQPWHLTVAVPGGELQCDLVAVDQLACAFERLSLQTARLADADVGRLDEISQGLARRLTYLLEPIRPIEKDAEAGIVQSRSNPPTRSDEQGTCYYELLAERGGRLTLSRYAKLPGRPRQPVPAQVTREVLYRLADDLWSAVN